MGNIASATPQNRLQNSEIPSAEFVASQPIAAGSETTASPLVSQIIPESHLLQTDSPSTHLPHVGSIQIPPLEPPNVPQILQSNRNPPFLYGDHDQELETILGDINSAPRTDGVFLLPNTFPSATLTGSRTHSNNLQLPQLCQARTDAYWEEFRNRGLQIQESSGELADQLVTTNSHGAGAYLPQVSSSSMHALLANLRDIPNMQPQENLIDSESEILSSPPFGTTAIIESGDTQSIAQRTRSRDEMEDALDDYNERRERRNTIRRLELASSEFSTSLRDAMQLSATQLDRLALELPEMTREQINGDWQRFRNRGLRRRNRIARLLNPGSPSVSQRTRSGILRSQENDGRGAGQHSANFYAGDNILVDDPDFESMESDYDVPVEALPMPIFEFLGAQDVPELHLDNPFHFPISPPQASDMINPAPVIESTLPPVGPRTAQRVTIIIRQARTLAENGAPETLTQEQRVRDLMPVITEIIRQISAGRNFTNLPPNFRLQNDLHQNLSDANDGSDYGYLANLEAIFGPVIPVNSSQVDINEQVPTLLYSADRSLASAIETAETHVSSETETTILPDFSTSLVPELSTSVANEVPILHISSPSLASSELSASVGSEMPSILTNLSSYSTSLPSIDSESTLIESDAETHIPMSTHCLNELLSDTAHKCNICLSDYELNDSLRVLGCLHGFHRECLDNVIAGLI